MTHGDLQVGDVQIQRFGEKTITWLVLKVEPETCNWVRITWLVASEIENKPPYVYSFRYKSWSDLPDTLETIRET